MIKCPFKLTVISVVEIATASNALSHFFGAPSLA
jgi:hypothetical protein